jgi:hypothetical protein
MRITLRRRDVAMAHDILAIRFRFAQLGEQRRDGVTRCVERGAVDGSFAES